MDKEYTHLKINIGDKTQVLKIPKNAIGINYCIINRNQGTFSIVLAKSIIDGEIESVCHVSIDPIVAKQISQMLTQHVNDYEKSHGEIKLESLKVMSNWRLN